MEKPGIIVDLVLQFHLRYTAPPEGPLAGIKAAGK
jgi:hypothetical protein